jgi:hypothetical protein
MKCSDDEDILMRLLLRAKSIASVKILGIEYWVVSRLQDH